MRMPRPRFATRLMARQLTRKPVKRKKATRESERSSAGERDEAKMARRTAGVTGMRLDSDAGGGGAGGSGGARAPAPAPVAGPTAAAAAARAEKDEGWVARRVVERVGVVMKAAGVTVLVDAARVGVEPEPEPEPEPESEVEVGGETEPRVEDVEDGIVVRVCLSGSLLSASDGRTSSTSTLLGYLRPTSSSPFRLP